MPWFQTDATHYHAQLGLQDKGRTINGYVVCYDPASMGRIYDQWDGSVDRGKVRGSGRGQDVY